MESNSSRKCILVIDDEELIRSAIAATLEGNGYDVYEADSGETGLAQVHAHRPDLIICDVHMEGIDGYTVLEKLQKQSDTATIPFLFLTGYTDHEHFRQGMTLGADDYLLKPITHSELLMAVEKRLEKYSVIHAQTERRLDALRANISLALPHELRTPLHGILGFCNILLKDHETLPRQDIADLANRIHRAADRLQRLVENFLIYAQLEVIASDQRQLEELRSDKTPDALRLLQLICRLKASEYQRLNDIHAQGENVTIAASQRTITKIVEELVDNALKFSEAGTPVTVNLGLSAEGCVISVSDRGHGMTEEQLKGLGAYMQFNRRVQEQQGSGLGLVIAKRLTELHLGTMTVESAPDAGTTIRVALPGGL